MNKEDILNEIKNNIINESYFPSRSDCCDIEEQVFQDIILDNIECHRIIFWNCKFKNVQFADNKIEWIRFEECEFENTIFSGKYENVQVTIMDSRFNQCVVRDFELMGYNPQSEIVDCTFDSCNFSKVKVETDLTISGGEIIKSSGNELDCKINMIFEVKFANSKFSNVNIEAAILDNLFSEVEITDIDLKERCVIKNNKYEKCYIDSKLVEG